jgi:hypothetical protein
MSDKTTLIIELTPEQHRQIEERAHQRGYNTPEAYLLALFESDEIEADQAYFWTEEWQAGERKVDEEIATGQHTDSATMDDFITDLMSDDE